MAITIKVFYLIVLYFQRLLKGSLLRNILPEMSQMISKKRKHFNMEAVVRRTRPPSWPARMAVRVEARMWPGLVAADMLSTTAAPALLVTKLENGVCAWQ